MGVVVDIARERKVVGCRGVVIVLSLAVVRRTWRGLNADKEMAWFECLKADLEITWFMRKSGTFTKYGFWCGHMVSVPQ